MCLVASFFVKLRVWSLFQLQKQLVISQINRRSLIVLEIAHNESLALRTGEVGIALTAYFGQRRRSNVHSDPRFLFVICFDSLHPLDLGLLNSEAAFSLHSRGFARQQILY